ncbi:MAG: VTC domain-containing protein [Bulleidia sp.]
MRNMNVFERHELKYMMDETQYRELMEVFPLYMKPDIYDHSEIYNLYCDTENNDLIIRSMEKPVYKEKMRIRSYRESMDDDVIFMELKKKYMDVVYKRRIEMQLSQAFHCLDTTGGFPDCQIGREMETFLTHYRTVHPAMFIGYERDSFVGIKEEDLRITFDRKIRWRDWNLALRNDDGDRFLLKENQIMMEVKALRTLPLWLVHWLSEHQIYRTSFSKYGMAYTIRNGGIHA